MRVRQFTQDDAHIFCTEDADRRRGAARSASWPTASTRTFGFTYHVKLALRPEKRFGTEETGTRPKAELRDAVAAQAWRTTNTAGKNCPAKARSMRPSWNGT
jgi:threonyl-tRNA synthetase